MCWTDISHSSNGVCMGNAKLITLNSPYKQTRETNTMSILDITTDKYPLEKRIPTYSNCILDYRRLERITTVEKPYRRTTDKYPLEKRRYAEKCFREDTLNNEKVYRVYRGDNYCGVPNEIGIVYPDNSFEFTLLGNSIPYKLKLSISTGGWLSSCAYLNTSSKHGGALLSGGGYASRYPDSNTKFTHPVFRGLRIYVNTLELHESCNYEIVGYKTNIKAVKAAFKPYKESFTVADIMFRNMRDEDIIGMVSEMNMGGGVYNGKGGVSWRASASDTVFDLETITANPLLSMLELASLGNINSLREHVMWAVESANQTTFARSKTFVLNKDTLVANTIKAFKRKLCREDIGNLLIKIVHEPTKKFPSSIWSNEIRLAGILVDQYK